MPIIIVQQIILHSDQTVFNLINNPWHLQRGMTRGYKKKRIVINQYHTITI